jgi:hypothetical protein
MNDGKRRSDRIVLTIPLSVYGKDAAGCEFRKGGRTLTINRHGARIQFHHALSGGQIIRILSLASKKEATFRVIGPVAPFTDRGGEWGVECVDPKANIWGVQFPPIEECQNTGFKALLECKKCHTTALHPVSLVEVEVLDTSGIIIKPCEDCQNESSWGYVEMDPVFSIRSGDKMVAAGKIHSSSRAQKKPSRQRHRQDSQQVSVLVRDYYGSSEIARSESVSQAGFCFFSEKDYMVGQGILATCPYDSQSTRIETRARIVQCQENPETHRKVYVARYEPRSEEFGPAPESTA